MLTSRIVLAAGFFTLLGVCVPSPPSAFGQPRDGAGQQFGQPARDTSALDRATGVATLSGRVLAADTGAVVKRATVRLAGQDTRDRRTVQTDDNGRYLFTDLQAGHFTVTVSKAGFISLAYGQKHPRQPALPIQVDAGRQIRSVDIALPRGSVLTGHVVDEDGEPMPRAVVQVLRYVYRQGQREIEPAGTDQTDDRGQFRVFDLDPGEYYVSVTLPRRRSTFPGGGRVGRGGSGARGGRGGRGGFGGADTAAEPETVGFAPTYYPGVTTLREATPLTLGLSQELSGIAFAAQLVQMARVGGLVFSPDGSAARGTQIMLTSVENTGRMPGALLGSRVNRDGSFEVDGVPPGRYTVQARQGRGRGDNPLVFATTEITVNGQDVTDLSLILRRGAEIRGTVIFDGKSMPESPGVEQQLVPSRRIVVTTSPLNSTPFEGRGVTDAGVQDDGSFVLSDVGSGPRLIRMSRMPEGLQLKGVYLDGRNVIDTPLDFAPEQTISGVTLEITARITELTGLVHDDQGNALTEFTVIAFPTNDTLWQPQSRHIMASRPDQNAQYRIRGLPPGDYLLSVVEVVQQGEWFDPHLLEDLQRRAARVTLRDGESQSLNLELGAAH